MESGGNNILFIIITLVIDLYLFALLLRLLLQKLQGPFYNPISQFIVKITEPVIHPTSRIIPAYRGINLAIVVVAVLIIMIINCLILWISFSAVPNLIGLFIVAAGSVAEKTINILFFAVIINAIISWFPSLRTSQAAPIVNCLSAPLLNIARRFIPAIGGIDLSPIIVLIGLKLISILMLYPIIHMGATMTLQQLIPPNT